VQIGEINIVPGKPGKIGARRLAVRCTQQRFPRNNFAGERVDDRLEGKGPAFLIIDYRGIRIESILIGDKNPAVSGRNLKIVRFFRGFDKSTEKLQRPVVIGELIF
jgi:hypothetical protein